MSTYQINRIYSLVVGTQEKAIEITNLQMTFKVTKTSSNKEKKNNASVEIYNLKEEHQKLLEEKYVTVRLKVGYAGVVGDNEDMSTLFTGQVVDNETKKDHTSRTTRNGVDTVTKLTVDEFFVEMNSKQISKAVPSGKKVKDVIVALADELPEITRREIAGSFVEEELPDGYPLTGTPRQILDDLSTTYPIEWQIDSGVLYVSDRTGTYVKTKNNVPLIGEFSGMVGRPEFKSANVRRIQRENEHKSTDHIVADSIQLKILLNPTLTAGSVIKLEWGDLNGYYKVDEIEHSGDYRGSNWYSDLILTPQSI